MITTRGEHSEAKAFSDEMVELPPCSALLTLGGVR
jgi:hypothetical protein